MSTSLIVVIASFQNYSFLGNQIFRELHDVVAVMSLIAIRSKHVTVDPYYLFLVKLALTSLKISGRSAV
jgi:L-lysine 2,3-aminomutase